MNSGTWTTVWAASAQGPYPSGAPVAQPELRFALPSPVTGLRDQSLRMIVLPGAWGRRARVRLSNAFGTRDVTFDAAFAGQCWGSAAIVPGTQRPLRFSGETVVTVPPGAMVWSDAVELPWAAALAPHGAGTRLAVSFHVPHGSGAPTWHAKAMATSYLTPPATGPRSGDEAEHGFPFSTTSWFFLDAIDMETQPVAAAVIAFGDSLTDGTGTTLNGGDRWTDVLQRRLYAAHGPRFVVVNAGIGGNQVAGPARYLPSDPWRGGPAAVQRLERDVLSLSGVGAVIWFEGINDFSGNANASVEAVAAAMTDGVARIRRRFARARVLGATLPSVLGGQREGHGDAEQDRKRRAFNDWLRDGAVFDAIVDFAALTLDPATGRLRDEYVPDSGIGGPGDGVHPNRTGHLAMGTGFPLDLLTSADPHR
jgi:lysophospholipase L1-like esterase